MSFHDFLNLRLVLGLHGFHDRVLVILRLLLFVSAAPLQLLECDFEFALRLKQIALVIVLLCL